VRATPAIGSGGSGHAEIVCPFASNVTTRLGLAAIGALDLLGQLLIAQP